MFVLYLLCFLDIFNMSLFMSVCAKQVILLGGSHMFAGVLGSTGALLGLFWKPITGNLSEEKGYKKLLIWCIVPSIIGNLISCFSPSTSIFFISRVICALGSPVQTFLITAASDVAKTNQSDVFNKIAAVCSVSFMLGILLSGHVAGYEKGIKAVYSIIIASSIISLVAVQLYLPNQNQKKSKPKSKKSTNLKESLKTELQKSFNSVKNVCFSNKYWDVVLIKTASDVSFLVLVSNLGYRLRIDYELEDKYVAYFMLAILVLSMVVNLSLVKIDRIWKNKTRQGLLYGSALTGIGFAGLALAFEIKAFSFFLLLISVVKPSVDSDLTKMQLGRIGNDEKAVVFSSFDTVYSMIELTSPITSSLIIEYFGVKTNYWFCGALVSLGVIPLLRQREKVE